jgi:nucleoside-diphosphate-sugar epimerase
MELAQTIQLLTRSTSKIVTRPLPVDDPKVRCPDISLAKSKLKWEPEINLKAGLSKTIPYFKKALCMKKADS